MVSHAISKRIKRGWLVVILAPADISQLVPFILNHKVLKVNHFLIFFQKKIFIFSKLINFQTIVCKKILKHGLIIGILI